MNVPKLRFKEFTDVWKEYPLKYFTTPIKRKNINNESDLPLTISSLDGLVDQRTYFNKVVASKDMSNYYLLKKGEFAYNKATLLDFHSVLSNVLINIIKVHYLHYIYASKLII